MFLTSPAMPEARQQRPRGWLILLIILILAGVLRCVGLGERALSMDELWTMELSTGRGSAHLELPRNQIFAAPAMTRLDGAPPWYRVWTSMQRATHPPLYFLILRLWRDLFTSDVGAVALSVIASLAAIVLLYDSARQICRNETPALWACAVMAIAQPQIEHAQLVRNYAVLLLFGMLTWWAISRIDLNRWCWIVLLGTAILCLLLTHYFAVGAVVAVLLYAMIELRGVVRARAIGTIVAAVAVWLILWGPAMLRHARHFSSGDATTEFLKVDRGGRLTAWALELGAVPLRMLINPPEHHNRWSWLVGLALLAPLPALRRRRELLLPYLWLICIVGFVAVLDLIRGTRQLEYIRYTLLASPALYLLIAQVGELWRWPNPAAARVARHALPAVALLCCMFGVMNAYLHIEPNWPTLTAFLDDPSRREDPVVFHAAASNKDWAPGYLLMAYEHYSAQPDHGIGRPVAFLDPPAPPSLLSALRERPRAWLISVDPEAPAERLLPGFETRPNQLPDFPPILWELRPGPAER